MNNKRLMPAAEGTKVDNLRRNHSSAYQNSRKKLNLSEESNSSLSSMSSFSSGRGGAIDAQTFVDAQSNGLTKRIVRYDEEYKATPQRYNRIYKKPGDFPIVHLDKPKLVLTPKQTIASNPSKMARIGHSDLSINRTNIRAEILRNGTMMPQISVDRREDVDSIRVDPLDALKEISRKRIHCEDTINQIQPTLEKDSTDSLPSGTNSKRQRIASSFNSPSANEANRKANSKCNEILSSLSSSSYMRSPSSATLKRPEASSPSDSVSSPQAKRLQADRPIEVPVVDETINSVPKTIGGKVVSEVGERTYPTESPRPKLTLFNRPYSANTPVLPPVSNDRNDECNISFVKPRPMTARSRESVENWLKIKPDEKRRLALMLSCLSGGGEVDEGDTVDSKGNELPAPSKSANPIAANDNTSKLQASDEKNAIENNIPPIVAVTAPIVAVTAPIVAVTASINTSSTTSSILPSKPAITFTPLSTVSTSTSIGLPFTMAAPVVLPTVTTVQAAPAIEERKGGFSFPLATKDSPLTTSTTSAVLTPAPSASSPALATFTPSLVTSPANIIAKDSIQTSEPSVTFTFHAPKPTVTSSSPAVPTVEPTKTFSFGNVTNASKITPVFGSSTTAETTKQITSSVSGAPTEKPTSFAAFGQTSTANVDFGKSVSATTIPSSIFGTMTSSNAFSKAQPPSFGSISTTQHTAVNDKPIQQPNMTSTFSMNDQIPVFGSALSSNSTSNAQNQLDPRTSNNATVTSFTPNQQITTTSAAGVTPSFAFGGSTANSAFKTAQPTLSSTSGPSFGNKPVNIFGSMAAQGTTTTTPIFGSSANTNTNLFDQSSKVGSIQQPVATERNVTTQSIFGSSTAKPAPAFSFSANNQPSTNNIFGSRTSAESGTGNAFNNFVGSNQKSSDLSTGSVGTNKSFTFSANNNAEATKPVVFGSKGAAPFSNSNVTDSAKSVGFAANNQTSATNLFNNKPADDIPKLFSFGGTSNLPSGGATSGTTTFGGSGMTAFGGGSSSFGGAASAASTFGGTNAAPAFGNATQIFGSTNAPPAFGNATQIFGSTNAPPAFGNATQIFGSTNAPPAFGASSNSTSTFGKNNATPSFGSSNASQAFGGNSATSAFSTNSATPSFGSTQGFNANIATPTFGTTFNSSSSSGFGGNSGTPAPAFTTSTGTAEINKSFNFTGNDPAPSPVPNLFNIGPGNPAPRGRTIRTATRRTYR